MRLPTLVLAGAHGIVTAMGDLLTWLQTYKDAIDPALKILGTLGAGISTVVAVHGRVLHAARRPRPVCVP
jgi:hypothetical protein